MPMSGSVVKLMCSVPLSGRGIKPMLHFHCATCKLAHLGFGLIWGAEYCMHESFGRGA